MTSSKKEVSRAVFSSRLVVPSISAKTLARAAYGTLTGYGQVKASKSKLRAYGCPTPHPPSMSTSLVLDNAVSALCVRQKCDFLYDAYSVLLGGLFLVNLLLPFVGVFFWCFVPA